MKRWAWEDWTPPSRKAVFDAHTDWAARHERKGNVEAAQRTRDNRWKQCPNGPTEKWS